MSNLLTPCIFNRTSFIITINHSLDPKICVRILVPKTRICDGTISGLLPFNKLNIENERSIKDPKHVR